MSFTFIVLSCAYSHTCCYGMDGTQLFDFHRYQCILAVCAERNVRDTPHIPPPNSPLSSHASHHPSVALGIIKKCLFAQCVSSVSVYATPRSPPQHSCLLYQHGIIHYVREGSSDNAGEHPANVMGTCIPALVYGFLQSLCMYLACTMLNLFNSDLEKQVKRAYPPCFLLSSSYCCVSACAERKNCNSLSDKQWNDPPCQAC